MSEQVGVPGPVLKLYLTNVEAIPSKVPGPADSALPGIALVLHSGNLTVHALMPADQADDVAEIIHNAGIAARMDGNGNIIIPGSFSEEELGKLSDAHHKLKGDD